MYPFNWGTKTSGLNFAGLLLHNIFYVLLFKQNCLQYLKDCSCYLNHYPKGRGEQPSEDSGSVWKNAWERWNLKMDFTSWKRIDHTELFIQLQTLIKSIAGGWGLKPTQIYNWTKFSTRNSSISSVAEQAAVSPSLISEIHSVKISLSCLYKRGGEEDLHFSNLQFKDNTSLLYNKRKHYFVVITST